MSDQSAKDFDAVHQMSISDFFEREFGLRGKKVGDTIRFSACPCCGEGPTASVRLAVFEDDMRYKCFRSGERGDIVDAAKLLWGGSTRDVIDRLLGRGSTNHQAPVIKPRIERDHAQDDIAAQKKASALRLAIEKIQAAAEIHKDEPACLDYLLIERSLPLDLIREAQRRKMLCFMPHDPKEAKAFLEQAVGEELLKASGLWKDGTKSPAVIWRPLVFIMPGFHSAAFRLIGNPTDDDTPKEIRYGKGKLPWVYRTESSTSAMVVEGFIDMLSAVALGYTGHVVGLPGCNNWQPEWFHKIAAQLGVTRWIEALDNDNEEVDDVDALKKGQKLKNPGQFWANKLRELFNEMKMEHLHRSPPPEMDINDLLRERVKKAA